MHRAKELNAANEKILALPKPNPLSFPHHQLSWQRNDLLALVPHAGRVAPRKEWGKSLLDRLKQKLEDMGLLEENMRNPTE